LLAAVGTFSGLSISAASTFPFASAVSERTTSRFDALAQGPAPVECKDGNGSGRTWEGGLSFGNLAWRWPLR